MRHRIAVIALLLAVPVARAGSAEDSDPALDPVARLTGAHTRLVWVQDISKNSGDTFAKGKHLRLMGYDSQDARGVRAILSRTQNYCKPLLTPDGKRVVYSDLQKGTMHVVGFGGGDAQSLGKGMAADVWADPETGTVWVYYQTRSGEKKAPIWRMRLDKRDVDELVWNKTPVNIDSFQLSRDGKRAAGLFPWANAGRATLPNKSWIKTGRGCWTSMAPDNSYLMWIFDGPHRNVNMKPAGKQDGWTLPVDTAKGIRGYEVYHPRWSNHVRYIVVTGPYVGKGGKPGGNRIRGGGPAVEIHLGKLMPDALSVAEWVTVTSNKRGDFYPDAWIEGGDQSTLGDAVGQELATIKERPLEKHKAWPGSKKGLEFLWKDAGATNQITDADGNAVRSCRVKARVKAIFGRWESMDTAGGAFVAIDANGPLLTACRKSNEVTIEATIVPDNLKQDGPARIVSFSRDASHRNFTLGQAGRDLILRIRTPRTGENGTKPQVTLAKLTAGQPHHVVVSYRPGRLLCVVNGKQTCYTTKVTGTLRNWEPMALIFGDEYADARDWAGRIEGVAIYSRFVGPREAGQKYELNARRLEGRKKPPAVTVTAELVEKTPTPDKDALQEYTRGLVVYTYKVTAVRKGKLTARRIHVAHWAMLDDKPVGLDRTVGKPYTMTIEPFDANDELEGERLFNTSDEFDLPVFYDPSR